jgi:hypothetical protein
LRKNTVIIKACQQAFQSSPSAANGRNGDYGFAGLSQKEETQAPQESGEPH